MTGRLPLAGVTVISLEQAVTAPFATRQLAALDARVIKIERASGDFARGYDSKVAGMARHFVWLNRGKESIVLDLKSPQGLQILRTLVSQVDVLVQNLAPGAIERLGMGADDALALKRMLIHTSISGYGRGGSYEQKRPTTCWRNAKPACSASPVPRTARRRSECPSPISAPVCTPAPAS